jgi:hypothetical protein
MIVAAENRFIFRGFHKFCLSDRPASDCADRPLSGRDFASPATSSVNHSRGNLTARVSEIQSKENSWKKKMNGAAAFRNRSLSL